jgi:hypothetical protein
MPRVTGAAKQSSSGTGMPSPQKGLASVVLVVVSLAGSQVPATHSRSSPSQLSSSRQSQPSEPAGQASVVVEVVEVEVEVVVSSVVDEVEVSSVVLELSPVVVVPCVVKPEGLVIIEVSVAVSSSPPEQAAKARQARTEANLRDMLSSYAAAGFLVNAAKRARVLRAT